MSEYNRHKFAMEWMHGGGRDPNGRGLDEEIQIANDMWKEFNSKQASLQVMPAEWDELSPKEELYYQQGPFSTDEVFLGSKGGTPQLVQPGPGRQGYQGFDSNKARNLRIQEAKDKGLVWDEKLKKARKPKEQIGFRGVVTTAEEKFIKKAEQILKKNLETKNGVKVFTLEKDPKKGKGLVDVVMKEGKLKNYGKVLTLINGIAEKNGWLTPRDYRRYLVVDSFMKDYALNDQFTGEGKFNKRLKEFWNPKLEDRYKGINKTFLEWARGDFEVAGFDRSKFNPLLKKNLKNWKPIRGINEKAAQTANELQWLHKMNTEHPDWTAKKMENAFNNKFKNLEYWTDTNFANRSQDLYGILVHGENRTGRAVNLPKGDRAPWLKKVVSMNMGGNYQRFLVEADRYEAKGNVQIAKKLRKAAKDLFGSTGELRKAGGHAEHPWFWNYGGVKGMFQIDSLVQGDLNNFKFNNFEGPIQDLIDKYESAGDSLKPGQKKAILAEIDLRRNFLNVMTDIGDGGMARHVTFDSTSTPGKIKVINKTPDIYGVHKAGQLDPLELKTRGGWYRDALIKNLTDQDVNILKKDETIKIGKIGAARMNEIIKAYQKAGIGNKCQWEGKAEGGRIGFDDGGFNNCMKNAIEENKKQMMSKTPEERAAAVMKNRNAVNAMKKIKGFGKLITRGVRGTAATLGLNNPGAWLLEAALEGGFYEYYRRKGYTHDQAYQETFIPGMVTGRPHDVPWYGGAEKLLEKELIGENKTVQRYFDNLAALDAASAEYSQLENAISLTQQGMGYGYDEEEARTNIAEGQARLKELQEEILRLNNLTKEGTPDWQSYQTALEKQQTEQGQRAIEWGEYGQGDTEALAKQRERVRQREMEDKFPDYQKAEMDQMLENWGVYIDPNLRSYKGKTVQRPEGLQYMGKPVLNPDAQRGWTYDDFNDYLKYQDKMKYFADNFMLEKKTGGRVSYLDGGIVSLLKK